jgi:hypothetical protein
MKTYGITFQSDSSGKPFVGLIDGKAGKDGAKMKIKVDGEEIETFSFLHFIAQTEKNSRVSYKDRIK